MNKKYLLLLDNSFREKYCYSVDMFSNTVLENWNSIIKKICYYLPEFENDYIELDIPLIMFESIGFGSFNKRLSLEKKDLLKKCFPKSSNLLIPEEYFIKGDYEYIVRQLDSQFGITYNKLFEFYKNELNIKQIIEAINKKTKIYLHPHVENLKHSLEEWKKSLMLGEEGHAYTMLCRDLAWNALVKHEKWFNVEDDSNYFEKRNSAARFIQLREKQIILRLIKYYLDNIQTNDYLAGAVLLIKYARLLNSNNKENSDSLKPYHAENELLDPYLTEYAVTGFYDKFTHQRKEVIILTCDKKQEKRLKDYIAGLKAIKGIANIELESFKPGAIVLTDSVLCNDKDFIEVRKLF